MITISDSINTFDLGQYYAIIPEEYIGIVKSPKNIYLKEVNKVKRVPDNFYYSSGNNKDFLSIDSIRKLIKENINSEFIPF